MSVKRTIDEIHGKTIATAELVPRQNGDAELVIRFTDGSVALVSAWKRAAQSIEMNIDLSPNDHPTYGGGAKREI